MAKKYLRSLLTIAVISLILNVLWENVQAPLYGGYAGLTAHLPMCMRAAVGDVLIILFIYGLFVLLYQDERWFQRMNWKSLALLSIIGAGIGIGIERWALSSQRWDYTQSMPIIPTLEVGLTPVLQMIILPMLTFHLMSKYTSRA